MEDADRVLIEVVKDRNSWWLKLISYMTLTDPGEGWTVEVTTPTWQRQIFQGTTRGEAERRAEYLRRFLDEQGIEEFDVRWRDPWG